MCACVCVSFCAYVYSEHLPEKGKVRFGSKVCSSGEVGGHDMEKRGKEKKKQG